MRIARASYVMIAAALFCVAYLAAPSFGALASKSTGKAVTSANLSTNPTIRKQQLLVDPATPDPLVLTYARLDVLIHLDTPLGYNAHDIVSSIDVMPLPHFLPVGTEPYYNTEASLGVTFKGNDILVSDFIVEDNPDDPPPPGEVDHAQVTVFYNNLLPAGIYDNVLATFTVQTNPLSDIKGLGTDGQTYDFPADSIIPATASQFLGEVPEPATAGLVSLAALVAAAKRPRRGL